MRKKLILAGIAVLFILMAWAITASLTTHSRITGPRKVSDDFVSSMVAGDYQKSYAQFSEHAKQKQSYSEWVSTVAQLHHYFDGATQTYQDASATPSSTTIHYRISAHQSKYLFTVTLSKSTKQWRVDAFTSKQQV